MGRSPKLRLNFDSDVQYLLRLKHAVEEDREYPKQFRDDLVSKIMPLVMRLMNAPVRGEVKEQVKKRAKG